MYNFEFQKELGAISANIGNLIDLIEENNDILSDGFSASQLERLVLAQELVRKVRVAVVETEELAIE